MMMCACQELDFVILIFRLGKDKTFTWHKVDFFDQFTELKFVDPFMLLEKTKLIYKDCKQIDGSINKS